MNFHDQDEWIIVLEFVPQSPDEPFAYQGLNALVQEMSAWRPAALFSTDRYALQLRVAAQRPGDALHWGLALHDEAALTVGLGRPVLVRTEVLTGTEFESQWDEAEAGSAPAARALAENVLCDDVYLATRAMLQSSTASELTDILVSFVTGVGGHVRFGAAEAEPGRLTVDLSLEGGPGLHATVDSVSVAGLIIEQSLPALVDDARAALTRLRHLHSVTDKGPGI